MAAAGSLTNTPSSPGTAAATAPSIGRVAAGSSPSGRATSITAGCCGWICSATWRAVLSRATPGRRAACSTQPGGKNTGSALLLPAPRKYRSAGSTLASQSLTALRKLATITVMATDSARLATTPATAALAVWRANRARRKASNSRGWRGAVRGDNRACTPAGTSTTPPASSAATAA